MPQKEKSHIPPNQISELINKIKSGASTLRGLELQYGNNKAMLSWLKIDLEQYISTQDEQDPTLPAVKAYLEHIKLLKTRIDMKEEPNFLTQPGSSSRTTSRR